MGCENTFAGARIDRVGPRRADPAWVAARLADPSSRALVLTGDGVHLDEAGRPVRLPLSGAPVLLGVEADGTALFAVEADGAAPSDGARLAGLRDAAAELDPEAAGLVAYALGMLNWHRRHGFCANCGAPTEAADAGFVRVCPGCGAHHHPRTDPVVIMLVVDPERDRILLGRQPSWPAGRYSALAGFVEPGEALEAAVAREVGEEAGVQVADVAYVSSQPWPFPASLMLGFTARWTSGEPRAADAELEDARWFTREEIERGEGLMLPPPVAIARRLIDGWLAKS